MNRDAFVFYKSFHEALEPMEPEQYKRVMVGITNYALNGEEPELSGMEKSIFLLIKPQIDANQKRYDNGRKGGLRKPNGNQTLTKPKPTVNQRETKP